MKGAADGRVAGRAMATSSATPPAMIGLAIICMTTRRTPLRPASPDERASTAAAVSHSRRRRPVTAIRTIVSTIA